MPLLNQKNNPNAINLGESGRNEEKVQSTNEPQSTYEEHSKRLALYQQPIWECEITGRNNLTYEQALDSERIEKYKAEFKLPKVLRKAILGRVEFQTADLDAVVDDIVNNFKNKYVIGEIVYCTLNNNNYFARIVNVPVENQNPPENSEASRHGRLRFPDAFLHQPTASSERKSAYKVQLIDERGRSLEEYIRTVSGSSIRRENGVFSHYNVQRFILECFNKNGHHNSPWLIKPSIAARYYDDLEPQKTQQSSFHSYKKQRTLQRKTIEERLGERQVEEHKRQFSIKYPIEDLDLPDYRKNPSLNISVINMVSPKYTGEQTIPNPSGGKPSRPYHSQVAKIAPEMFDLLLSSWTFLTVFGEPLKTPVYSLEELENALIDNSIQARPNVLVEYHACLLNAIIKERNDDSVNEVIKGYVANSYIEAMEQDAPDDSNKKSVLPLVERGWQDEEHLKISEKWDHKEIRASSDRRGWMTSLIGCLNDVATPEMIPEIDEILQHLIPRLNSTASEREKQYSSLSLKQKLDILQFLVNTVIESNLIRNHIEYCQEQIVEHRRQKVEVSREMKSLSFKRYSVDKYENSKRKTEKEHIGVHIMEIDSSESPEKDTKGNLKKNESQLEPDQDKKDDELDEIQQLEKEEKILKEKDEHLDICLRKCMTLRMQNLGKDRFYNQYMYFDNIGLSDTSGSGRLFIRSPSDPDIQLMMARDFMEDAPENYIGGYGGGRWFVLKLMKEHGLDEESKWLENRMKELDSDDPSDYKSWWKCYSEPEEIEQLLVWLNSRGVREFRLKKELENQRLNIIDSFKKRIDVAELKYQKGV